MILLTFALKMLFFTVNLKNIFRATKLWNLRAPYFSFQKLKLKDSKNFYTCTQQNCSFFKPFSSVNQRRFVSRSYPLKNQDSFAQEVVSLKTSDVGQIISQNDEKDQMCDEKVKIYFETMKGEKIECLACIDQSVMRASLDNDIAMHGNCEGEAICSVCHVYVDEKYQEFFPKVSEEEEEMLDMVANLQDNSRLSCQIKVRKELEGAVFKLPHYDGPSYGLEN